MSLDGVVDLLLRPERFFPERADRLPTAAVFTTIWVVGSAAAMDRIEQLTLRVHFGLGAPPLLDGVAASWLLFWAWVAGGGFVMGAWLWWVGGWWYAVRLRWSGDPDPDRGRARRLNVLADLAFAVPVVATMAASMVVYPSYARVAQEEPLLLSTLVLTFWPFYVSYRGAVASFRVDPKRARWWFAILPAGLTALLLGAVLAAALASGLGWLTQR